MDKSFIRAIAVLRGTNEEWIDRLGTHHSLSVASQACLHISSRIPFGLPLDSITNLPLALYAATEMQTDSGSIYSSQTFSTFCQKRTLFSRSSSEILGFYLDWLHCDRSYNHEM